MQDNLKAGKRVFISLDGTGVFAKKEPKQPVCPFYVTLLPTLIVHVSGLFTIC